MLGPPRNVTTRRSRLDTRCFRPSSTSSPYEDRIVSSCTFVHLVCTDWLGHPSDVSRHIDALPRQKLCPLCHRKKTVDAFHLRKENQDERRSECKTCQVVHATRSSSKLKARAGPILPFVLWCKGFVRSCLLRAIVASVPDLLVKNTNPFVEDPPWMGRIPMQRPSFPPYPLILVPTSKKGKKRFKWFEWWVDVHLSFWFGTQILRKDRTFHHRNRGEKAYRPDFLFRLSHSGVPSSRPWGILVEVDEDEHKRYCVLDEIGRLHGIHEQFTREFDTALLHVVRFHPPKNPFDPLYLDLVCLVRRLLETAPDSPLQVHYLGYSSKRPTRLEECTARLCRER